MLLDTSLEITMRAIASLLMMVLLITTPVTYVLAQAAQQQDAAVQAQPTVIAGAVVGDAARVERVIIGVPQLDPNSPAALLLAPAALDLNPGDALPPLTPTAAAVSPKTAIVLGLVAVLVAILIFVPCWECLGD
jgi:hypothetical protein